MTRISCREPEVKDSTILVHKFDPKGETRKYFEETELKVKYPVDISGLDDSILSIPLVANLAPVAWFTGNTLEANSLDEQMSKRLADIKAGYKESFGQANVDVDLHGEVAVNQTVEHNKSVEERRPAMLFTGGVDSVFAYLRRQSETPRLIFVRGNDREKFWSGHKRTVENFAEYYNTHPYMIESQSVEGFIDSAVVQRDAGILGEMERGWFAGVQYPISYMGLSSPLTEVEGLSPFYQASGATGESIHHEPEAIPSIVDSLSWGSTKCEMVDFGCKRQDKIERIVSEYEEDWNFTLCSCSKGENGQECSNCDGCYRNILALFTAGADIEKFGYELTAQGRDYFLEMFDNNQVEVGPFKAEFYNEMQQRLDPDVWSGPEELYGKFESTDIEIVDEPQVPLKIQIYRMLPSPLDNIVYGSYKFVRH